MNRDVGERIVGQFSGASDRADVWQALDLVLPTGRYLNLGYSRWYESHLVGSPQQRLVERVVDELAAASPGGIDGPILDAGCGRGGPARHVTERYGFDVVGLDLVPYNVAAAHESTADENADENAGPTPTFVVGEAASLPFDDRSFPACVSIDAIVYTPDKTAVLEEIRRVLDDGGVCVVSDLVAVDDSVVTPGTLRRFADAWDMPPLSTLDDYREAIESPGFRVEQRTDLTPNSVGRFRKWSRLFLALAESPVGPLLKQVLRRLDVKPGAVLSQVRAANAALPALRHVLWVLRKPESAVE